MAGLLQGKTGGASRGWALEVGGGRAALDGKPVEGYFSQITGESGGFPQGHISDIYIYIPGLPYIGVSNNSPLEVMRSLLTTPVWDLVVTN